MRILPALVALCQCSCLLAYVHSTTTAQQISTDKYNSNTVNKSLQFVNVIKNDLRRNNDDYELREGQNQLADTVTRPVRAAHPDHSVHPAYPVLPGHPTPPQPYHNIISPSASRFQPVPPARPRALSARPRELPARPPALPAHPPALPAHPPALPARPTARRQSIPARATPPHTRAAPLRRYYTWKGEDDPIRNAAVNYNKFRSYTRSKHDKSLRLNKLKRLLNKDKINMRQGDPTEAEDQLEAEDPSQAKDQLDAEDAPQTGDQLEAEDAPQTKDQLEAEDAPQAGDQLEAEDAPQAGDQLDTEDPSQTGDQVESEDTTTTSPPETEPTTQTLPPTATSELIPPLSLTHAPTTRRYSFRPQQQRGDQAPVLRNSKALSPSPEQLDMAHARNPEITRIRIKGRLCQRSLMNAEGPTYDRLGHMVRPAHRPRKVHGRKFHQTRAPSLLLPRCCNCCKKSVLGCQ